MLLRSRISIICTSLVHTCSLGSKISDNNVHCRAENINSHCHHLIVVMRVSVIFALCVSVLQRHKSVHGKFLDLHEQQFDELFSLH